MDKKEKQGEHKRAIGSTKPSTISFHDISNLPWTSRFGC